MKLTTRIVLTLFDAVIITFMFIQGTVEQIMDYMKLLCLFISSSAFTGMIPWLRGKKKRHKGGGLTTSIFVTVALIYLYPQNLSPWQISIAIAGSFLLGIIFVGPAENFILKTWGKQKNHRGVEVDRDFNITTIDEVHGLLIGVVLAYCFELSFIQFVIVQIVAFVAFRFFDVKKHWIIKNIEERQKTIPRIFSPLTIMIDDTVAGIYTMPITLVTCLVLKYWIFIARLA